MSECYYLIVIRRLAPVFHVIQSDLIKVYVGMTVKNVVMHGNSDGDKNEMSSSSSTSHRPVHVWINAKIHRYDKITSQNMIEMCRDETPQSEALLTITVDYYHPETSLGLSMPSPAPEICHTLQLCVVFDMCSTQYIHTWNLFDSKSHHMRLMDMITLFSETQSPIWQPVCIIVNRTDTLLPRQSQHDSDNNASEEEFYASQQDRVGNYSANIDDLQYELDDLIRYPYDDIVSKKPILDVLTSNQCLQQPGRVLAYEGGCMMASMTCFLVKMKPTLRFKHMIIVEAEYFLVDRTTPYLMFENTENSENHFLEVNCLDAVHTHHVSNLPNCPQLSINQMICKDRSVLNRVSDWDMDVSAVKAYIRCSKPIGDSRSVYHKRILNKFDPILSVLCQMNSGVMEVVDGMFRVHVSIFIFRNRKRSRSTRADDLDDDDDEILPGL